MGVLRALGCSGATLFKLVWSESLLISLTGAACGGILAVVLRTTVDRIVQSTLAFVPSGTEIAITPIVLLGGCLVVVVLCLLAGVYPAYKSSVVSPMVSMRGA
jgi:ABC-type lipoprotein release transport system permease subunit